MGQAQGCRPVGGFAHDLEVVLDGQHHAVALAQQRLVVGEHHPDAHATDPTGGAADS